MDYWVGVSSGGVGWDSSNNLVVWVSSNSGCVWIVSVGGSDIWVAGSISVIEDGWVSFRVSFTLGDDMSGNWVVNVWVSSVGGVWGYVVDGVLYLFDGLSIFVLLFSDLDRVGLFWDSFLGHAFGVMWVDIFDNWYSWYDRLDNWYGSIVGYYWLDNRAYNMSSISVVDTMDWYTSDVAVNELGVSFWFSKSDGHKGKQSNL